MKAYQYVFYGVLNLKLDSVLHIGGEEDEYFNLVTNGAGEYILPANSFTGSVRHYLYNIMPDKTVSLFGDRDAGDSRVYIYDSQLDDFDIEQRSGIQIDGCTGTAADGRLYAKYYLGGDLKTRIHMQVFMDSPDDFDEVFAQMIQGINHHMISFGSNKTTGGGQFRVTSATYNILNLAVAKDLEIYLKGINYSSPDSAFDYCRKYSMPNNNDSADELFILTAEIPDGILIGDSDVGDKDVDKVSMHHQINGNDIPFIPGTSIKGSFRAYAQKVVAYLNGDQQLINKMFGNSPTDNSVKQRGYLQFSDCNMNGTVRIVRDRVTIDRLLGAVMGSRKMDQEIVYTGKETTVSIEIGLEKGLGEFHDSICALIVLYLRDLGAGRITLGGGGSAGYGHLKGTTLKIDDIECTFSWSEDGMPSLNYDKCKNVIEQYLNALKGGNAHADQQSECERSIE